MKAISLIIFIITILSSCSMKDDRCIDDVEKLIVDIKAFELVFSCENKSIKSLDKNKDLAINFLEELDSKRFEQEEFKRVCKKY